MRFYLEGEKSSAVCDVDKRKVTTVMNRRDYQPEGFAEPIPGLLVAVCESCGTVLTIPAQSCARINALRKTTRPATKPIDARVSPELEEALNLVVSEVGGPASIVQSGLLRFYLGQVAESPEVAARVKERSTNFLVASAGTRRLTVRVVPAQFQGAARAAKAAGVKTNGELLRGIAALAVEDCGITYRDPAGHLVTSKPDPMGRQRIATLRQMVKFFA